MNLFSTIIGHEQAKSILSRQMEGNQLSHAYLFVGPNGVGRTTMAHALMRDFLGLVPGSQLSTHPDVLCLEREVDEDGKRKTEIVVSDARTFVDWFSLSPIMGSRKAAFVEEAERLNTSAANALLKTIEEPKGDTLLILRAPSLDALPLTIASRCQVMRFAPVPMKTIAEAVEKRGLDKTEAASIAQMSLGRPGHAIRFITDGAFRAAYEVAQTRVREWHTLPIYARVRAVADLLPKEEADKRTVLEETLSGLERAARAELVRCVESDPQGAQHWSQALTRIRDARLAASHNGNPQLCLEHAVFAL